MEERTSIKDVCARLEVMRSQGGKVIDKKSYGFDEFLESNRGSSVSGYDFLHAVYISKDIPEDFLIWFARLMWPDFMEVDGKIYVSDLFDAERYQGLIKEGRTESQSQFWMNLLEITGLFNEISDVQAKYLAQRIADSWAAKMRRDFGGTCEGARMIADEETGEVFVVIGNPE